jgi:serine/threonine protein phosphatase PrpC
LHEKTLATQWNLKKINRHDLKALILATDGVSDTWENLEGYVQGFYDYYKNIPSNSATMDIEQSLITSRPKGHTDDQTIVMALF